MIKKKNTDGMRYPSIDELVRKDDSFIKNDGSSHSKNHTKYQLAHIAAKRARQIEEDERRKEVLLNCHSDDDTDIEDELDFEDDRDKFLCVKPVGKALEEYLQGEVHCSFKSNDLNDLKNDDDSMEEVVVIED